MNELVWLALMVVFMLIEAGTVTMVSLWFAAGSLVALIAALLGAPVWLQVVLFFAVATVLLACLRPVVRSRFTPGLTRTNVDSIVGSRGYVTEDVDNVAATGRAKLGAMEWTVRSSSGTVIPKGTLVQVDKIEGVKAFVTPAEVSAETK